MQDIVELNCAWCNNKFELYKREYDRQIRSGRTYFFCSLSCVAKKRNASKKLPIIEKICPVCKTPFFASTKKKGATFCSRSCASRGSVTEYRKSKASEMGKKNNKYVHSNDVLAIGLRTRESWKYSLIKDFLEKSNIRYQFEFPCGSGIFDLALLDLKLFIEFDGLYHTSKIQKEIDDKKVMEAKSFGWNVVRISCNAGQIIDPNLIYHLFKTECK
jgi:very-short-patch-repair endonuclease